MFPRWHGVASEHDSDEQEHGDVSAAIGIPVEPFHNCVRWQTSVDTRQSMHLGRIWKHIVTQRGETICRARTRSGISRSSTAVPSARNSGLDRISKCTFGSEQFLRSTCSRQDK